MKKIPTKKSVTKNNNYRNRDNILAIFLFLFFVVFSQVYATPKGLATQQRQIKGVVTDTDNIPLSGVNVLVVGTTIGTETDFDGNYTIKAKEGDVLQFSFIGMKTKLITISKNNQVNMIMEDNADTLNEIVIVGYGSQKKTNVTGAVATVSAKDLVSAPTTNAVEALQGRSSGVTVINNGSPGSAPTIRIRGIGTLGNNNPIYVIDGIVTENMDGLSPDDIESISVLKDASTAAAYGSLGANGVIVVKTKTGKNGKTTFSFNSYLSTRFKPKKIDLLNSEQYVSYVTDMIRNNDPGADLPPRFANTNFISNNVDYQDAIFQQGTANNYELSASGGTENANFRLSGNYLTQEGTMLHTALDKYAFRVNSNFKKGRITFGETLALTYAEQDPLILAFSVSPIENAIKIAPYLPIYDANNVGGFSELSATDDVNTTRNPLRTLNRETQLNKNINLLGTVYGKVDITKNLTYKATLGMNFYDNKFKKVELPYGLSGGDPSQSDTRISYANARVNTITINNSLEYTKTFNENHNVKALVVAEQRKRKTTVLSGVGTTPFGITDLPSNLSGGAQALEYNVVGYLGRINYDFAGKYLLAVSLRRDASSRFGANYRWGNFPTVAAGWVLSKEDFLKDSSSMNYFKLRASWGLAGNDRSAGDYAFESSLLPNYFYGNNSGLATSSLPNPNLKWEETAMTNIGVDLGFLSSKITFSAEYYNNTSNDLIVLLPPAGSLGVPNDTPFNIGGMKTDGLEFNLGYRKSEGEFHWSASFNLSTTNNEVTQLAPNVEQLFNGSKPNVLASGSISRIAEGEALWHFYGWETDGIFQTQAEIDAHATQTGAAPGDIRFKDINNDGVINDEDRTVIGNPFPNVNYGLSLNADYKNFDFTALFTGVSGNDIFNASRYYLDGASQITNTSTAVLDRWTPTNPSTTQPRAIINDPNQNTRVSNRYVEDGSYFRLKNISIGYNMPTTMLSNISKGTISKLRVYVSAQNLFTITNYSGYDPEIGPSLGIASITGSQNSEIGVDRGQYPQSKSLLLGFQIKF